MLCDGNRQAGQQEAGQHLCSQPHLYHYFHEKNFARADSSSFMNTIADVSNDCIAKDVTGPLIRSLSRHSFLRGPNQYTAEASIANEFY